jgi:hypothetical protein
MNILSFVIVGIVLVLVVSAPHGTQPQGSRTSIDHLRSDEMFVLENDFPEVGKAPEWDSMDWAVVPGKDGCKLATWRIA